MSTRRLLRITARLLLFFLAVLLASAQLARAESEPLLEEGGKVYIINIKEAIMSRGLAAYITRWVAAAKDADADYIVVEIDTPGGLVDVTLAICDEIHGAAPVRTVAYVTGNAWSAGALIAIACDKIYMAPNATIGSASPVTLSPEGQPVTLGEKEVSAVRAKFKAWAQTKGHDPTLAVAMVDKDLEVKEVLVDGERRFLTEDDLEREKRTKGEDRVEEIGTVVRKDKLLNLTASDAQSYDFISGVVADRSELFEALGLRRPEVLDTQKSWSETFFGFLTNPMVAGLLLMIGLIGLYTEFKMPGFGLPGIAGISCLALFFFSHYLVGLANYTEILLFLAGVVLLVIELFVTPGFGFLGASGIVLILVGLFLTLIRVSLPTEPWDWRNFQNALLVMLAATTGVLVAAAILGKYLPVTPYLKRLILVSTGAGSGEAASVSPAPSSQVSVGEEGVTASKLRPAGKAYFGERLVNVLTEGDFIEKGATVRMLKVMGNHLVVREVKPGASEQELS